MSRALEGSLQGGDEADVLVGDDEAHAAGSALAQAALEPALEHLIF